MSKVIPTFQRMILITTALFFSIAAPLSVLADDNTSGGTSPSTSTPTQGPKSPPGPDANTYTYNSATGMWENDYYIWNPVTGQTTPKQPQTYSYNPATGHWDTTDWIYDAAQGKYVPNTVSVVTPPAGAVTIGGPTDSTVSTQGPNSPVTTNNNSTGLYDNFYNASISNTLNSTASTGNALVTSNTAAGSALTGNATAIANLINLLQSSTSLQGGSLATFTQNIYGNVQGDIMIDPSQLASAGSLSADNSPSNLTINSQGNGQINNDVTLGADSGNAAVSSNTTAGDATSGNANAIANIVNVINSIIGSGQSFMGTVNIFGNLDGDILMPPDVLNSLIAASGSSTSGGNSLSTSGPNSSITSDNTNSLNATLTDNKSINNALNLSATSGDATVSNNTSAGNATTGNAGTNLTVLNLTGSNVIGKDALLVFVNVLGNWVGMIVNSPGGSTAAALCNCSSTSTAGPNSPINSDNDSSTNLNSNSNSGINNNVKLASNSGNASVTDNTTAGNATSGNATASVNLLNIDASSLNLSNWLGILFINVFGSWNGSFGINTAAGNKPASGPSNGPAITEAVKSVKVFSFVPSSGSANKQSFQLIPLASASNPTSSNSSQNNQHGVVLSAANTTPPQSPASHSTSLLWTAGSLFFLAAVLSAEEAVTRRKETREKLRNYLHSITVPPLKKT